MTSSSNKNVLMPHETSRLLDDAFLQIVLDELTKSSNVKSIQLLKLVMKYMYFRGKEDQRHER